MAIRLQAPYHSNRGRPRAVGLHQRLRDATAELHERVERSVTWSPFERAEYVRFLEALAAAYLPIDAALQRHARYRATVPDVERRSRSWALRADLERVGGRVRAPISWPAMDLGAALGAAYVFEGATLGGAVVHRILTTGERPVTADACQFLRGYGADNGAMWRSFLAALQEALLTEAEQDSALTASYRVFEQLLAILERPRRVSGVLP